MSQPNTTFNAYATLVSLIVLGVLAFPYANAFGDMRENLIAKMVVFSWVAFSCCLFIAIRIRNVHCVVLAIGAAIVAVVTTGLHFVNLNVPLIDGVADLALDALIGFLCPLTWFFVWLTVRIFISDRPALPSLREPRSILATLIILLHPLAVWSIFYNVKVVLNSAAAPLIFIAYAGAFISMTTIWMVVGRMSFLTWRLPATGILLASEWMFLTHFVAGSLKSSKGPAWASFMASQFIVLAGLIWCISRWTQSGRKRPRFSWGQVLLFAIEIATFLGCLGLAGSLLGWTDRVLGWKFFFLCTILGLFNAMATIPVVVALASKSIFRKLLFGALGTALAALIGMLYYHTLLLVFGHAAGKTREEYALYMAAQAVCVWITVFPFWRWSRSIVDVSFPKSESPAPANTGTPPHVSGTA